VRRCIPIHSNSILFLSVRRKRAPIDFQDAAGTCSQQVLSPPRKGVVRFWSQVGSTTRSCSRNARIDYHDPQTIDSGSVDLATLSSVEAKVRRRLKVHTITMMFIKLDYYFRNIVVRFCRHCPYYLESSSLPRVASEAILPAYRLQYLTRPSAAILPYESASPSVASRFFGVPRIPDCLAVRRTREQASCNSRQPALPNVAFSPPGSDIWGQIDRNR
jgi:hypothetical protein